VLVVSSEAARRRALAAALMEEHDVLTAEDEAIGLSLLANTAVDVVVAELGRRGGAEMVDGFAAARPGVEVVLLGGEALQSEASARSGAFCVLDRATGTPTQVAWIASRACERKRLLDRIRRLERKFEHQERSGEIIGGSRAMDEVFDLAHGAAVASSPVLLVGESGTGKEMLARAMHRQGRRASGPFVAVDCAALPADRIELELFGSVNGGHHRPLALAADGGTLFLADVAMLPPSSQARLVQLLQHGEILRDEQSRPVDVRLIAATSIELKPRVDAGDVRRDLYFHLNALVIRIPPLRRRKDDIPLLAYHFLHRYAQRIGRGMRRISPEALRLMRDHRWAGNVRELEHAIERAVALARSDVVLPADLAFLREEQAASVVLPAGDEPRDTAFDPALFDLPYSEAKRQAVAAFDQAYVTDLLHRTGDNVSEAARQSGLDRSNFRRVMKKVKT
jgi:DNA-binding NtrC family response regulator